MKDELKGCLEKFTSLDQRRFISGYEKFVKSIKREIREATFKKLKELRFKH